MKKSIITLGFMSICFSLYSMERTNFYMQAKFEEPYTLHNKTIKIILPLYTDKNQRDSNADKDLIEFRQSLLQPEKNSSRMGQIGLLSGGSLFLLSILFTHGTIPLNGEILVKTAGWSVAGGVTFSFADYVRKEKSPFAKE